MKMNSIVIVHYRGIVWAELVLVSRESVEDILGKWSLLLLLNNPLMPFLGSGG